MSNATVKWTEAMSLVDPGERFLLFDSVVSWILGGFLILSGLPHLSNPYYFLGSVYRYELIPAVMAQFVAIVLPFLQLVLAACLIFRFFHFAAHTITLMMLMVFTMVQISVMVRGLDISCGCFGPRQSTNIDQSTIALVGGLLLLSITWMLGDWWIKRTRGQKKDNQKGTEK